MSFPSSSLKRNRSTSRLFGGSPFSPLTPIHKNEKKSRSSDGRKNKLSSASTPFLANTTDPNNAYANGGRNAPEETTPPNSATPSKHSNSSSTSSSTKGPLLKRLGRSPSVFGFKASAAAEEDTPPATASSSRPPSFTWYDIGSRDELTDVGKNTNILHHGETQTNSGLFRKKKEYLVLTDTHLVRFKNISKASETFHAISVNHGKAGLTRTNSCEGSVDGHSIHSEVSGEKVSGIPLEHIVAVYLPEDNRPLNSLELSQLDSDAGQGSSISFMFGDSDERDLWLRAIRLAANKARLLDSDPLTLKLAEYAARVVEREQDYDVSNFRIFKIVKRAASRSSSRNSHDETTKLTPSVCFLVIGAHKVHLINLPKNIYRGSTSSAVSEASEGGSFGILTLTWISVSATDDTFTLAFRSPLQRAKNFQLASLASAEIASRLRQHDSTLRPEWIQRPFAYEVPKSLDEDILLDETPSLEDHNCFDRTLVAFCIAYGVNPSSVRYAINYAVEDAPRFELLEPLPPNPSQYTALHLLAIMRALRYNESFASISFAHVSLDTLNGLYDRYGAEYVCMQTKNGFPLKLDLTQEQQTSALVQEIRALAVGNKKLRRMDFSNCIGSKLSSGSQRPNASGIVEALAPLCKKQMTNVDWLVLNGIELGESDLDHLVKMAADRACHFRAIAANNCGLTDRGMNLLLDALRAQINTLESIEIAHNPLRLVLSNFTRQLDVFSFIRKIDLSRLAIASRTEPLLPSETLALWRLEELRLGGVSLSQPSIDALCSYLSHPQSHVLRELILPECSLTGGDVARIMESMTLETGTARYLHLDVSDNDLQERHDHFAQAIARDLAPTHLSLQSTAYELSDSFRDLLLSVAKNRSIRYLDMARMSLPGEASEATCKALENVFAENQTLEELDISGEESRLEISKLGVGINQALYGLKKNSSIRVLRIQYQRLGIQGASTLSDVLKENRSLQQLHCDCNGITLSGFTDLVNALSRNRTLLYLPSLEEGRDAALRQTQDHIKAARSKANGGTIISASTKMSAMRRTFANIGGGGSASNAGGSSPVSPRPQTNAVPQWTEQDVQAALRLVSESWEGQARRLRVYLERNWRIAEGRALPEDLESEDEADKASIHRPGTAASISKVLERVKIDRTPTVEKELQLGDDHTIEDSSSHHVLSPSKKFLEDIDVDTTPVFEKDGFSFSPITLPQSLSASDPRPSSDQHSAIVQSSISANESSSSMSDLSYVTAFSRQPSVQIARGPAERLAGMDKPLPSLPLEDGLSATLAVPSSRNNVTDRGGSGGGGGGGGGGKGFRLSTFFAPASLKASDLELTLPSASRRL